MMRDWQDAELAFDEEDYSWAYQLLVPLYQVDSTSADLNYRLGVCLFEVKHDKENAAILLNKAVKLGSTEALFAKAKVLHAQMKFETALRALEEYNERPNRRKTATEISRLAETITYAREAVLNPIDVTVKNLGPSVNSEAQEYVPVVTGNNESLYFTSRRFDSTAQLKDPNNAYFEDVYVTHKVDGKWSAAVNLDQPVNTATHDATVSISADGQTMLIYRTNSNLTGGDLYVTYLKGGKWSNPERLGNEINSKFQEASACFSPDQQTLYFSSNRPEGFGGKDLYQVKKLPNQMWSLPKNLGPNINTAYDEDAPFMDVDDQTLYFASKGHKTMGGYDIFRTSRTGKNWSTPGNMGYPVNTVDDDLYLALDAGARRGYYSSDKSGGYGQHDIYKIDFIYRQQTQVVIQGKTLDLNDEPVQTTLTLLDEENREIHGVYRSNSNTGNFILIVHPLTAYKVILEAEGYDTHVDEIYIEYPSSELEEVEISPYVMSKK